jgi:sensor histidine kinase YesM
MRRVLIWLGITIVTFVIFYWLFRLGLPEAAFKFAIGATAIILGGLLTGNFVAYTWARVDSQKHNLILFSLSGSAVLCIILIGVFVNRMIRHTEFNYFLFTVLCLFLLSAFISATARLIRNRLKNNLRLAQAAITQSQAELQALQSQLSPHFLFNTLNNLYGLAITNSEKVPALILRLSDLLRFSIYEAKDMFVSLTDEIQYLENYIEFEKIRIGERLELQKDFESVKDGSIKIPSMLFIVFLENAFKHSKNNRENNIWISVSLRTSMNAVFFEVKNSCGRIELTNDMVNPHSGFGLESVRKRLNLLYPGAHELKIARTEKSFEIKLTLNNK